MRGNQNHGGTESWGEAKSLRAESWAGGRIAAKNAKNTARRRHNQTEFNAKAQRHKDAKIFKKKDAKGTKGLL